MTLKMKVTVGTVCTVLYFRLASGLLVVVVGVAYSMKSVADRRA